MGALNLSSLKGRRILVTGHTGFKGTWLVALLRAIGADVTGFALEPPTNPSLFEEAGLASDLESVIGNILNYDAVCSIIKRSNPDAILHLAAQSLVIEGYKSPLETFATNVQGTLHVLEAARLHGAAKAIAVVTTDKVYRPKGAHPHSEGDALGGDDPYSASKAGAELLVESYRASFFRTMGTSIASLRAGNVVGGGDWSANRLLPDAARAMMADRRLLIRHPDALRPWQDVLDVTVGYLHVLVGLIAGKAEFARAWNFGPPPKEQLTVRGVLAEFARAYGEELELTVETSPFAENPSLLLASDDARLLLEWQPRLSGRKAVAEAARFYRNRADGQSVASLMNVAINARLEGMLSAAQ